MKYFSLIFLFVLMTPFSFSFAEERPLKVSIKSVVGSKGDVRFRLTYKNISSQILYHVHPMFHFHHSMDMAPMAMKLEPGESKEVINKNHPKLLRVGRYPLVVLFKYKTKIKGSWFTQTFMDSFYFKEKLHSAVKGEIETLDTGDHSRLRIWIRNPADSFKNVRLMLLLPPGLISKSFNQMLGFTIRGGEEKSFEVDVEKEPESLPGNYPVHLMIEYGEMQKHYSSEVRTNLTFHLPWNKAFSWGHLVAFILFASFLAWNFKKNGWNNRKPEEA
jgi:hypothetical protein